MIGELTNHLWQSTLFAVAVGLLATAFRGNKAQVRHWLWFSASLKFLLPFALLMSLGSHLEQTPSLQKIAAPAVAPAVSPAVSEAMLQITEPFSAGSSFALPAKHVIYWAPIAIFVWVSGFAAMSVIRLRSWLRLRAVVRASNLIDIPGFIKAQASAALLEPGVVGFFRPVLLLPAGILERLTPLQLQAVLAHEMCHVRRRDNLTSAIHMMVEAIFWFHPFVWYVGARMVEERERACDEAVLSLGCEPRDYAEGILSVCKLYVESPLVCVSGITGANLKRRIEAIIVNRTGQRLSRVKKFVLVSAGVAVLVGPVVLGLTVGIGNSLVRAQSPAAVPAPANAPAPAPVVLEAPVKPSPAPRIVAQRVAPEVPPTAAPTPQKLEFEVASVKPVDPGVACCLPQIDSARFAYTTTLHDLMGQAYRAFFPCPTKADSGDCAFPGAPAWIYKERFAIEAKLPEGFPAYSRSQFMSGRAPQLNQMLQALLEDRFKLKVHWEARTIPTFTLTVGKNGPKVKPLADPEPGRVASGPGGGGVTKRLPNGNTLSTLNVVDSSIQNFADSLGEFMDRPVVDRTGLKGNFSFKVEWESEPDAPSNSGPGMIGRMMHAGPAMFTAIEEQLGLKLESTKGPIEVLVIDHVEQPSAN